MAEAVAAAKSLFADAKYAECKAYIDTAISSLSSENDAASLKELKLILRKASTHLDVTPTSASSEQAAPVVATTPTPTVVSAPPAAPISASSIRFEWFQTPNAVTLTFYVKNRTEQDVVVNATERSIDIAIGLGEAGREYQYAVERLFAPVATPPTVSVRSMKVEVVLTKHVVFHWPTLEVKDDDIVRTIERPEAVAAATAPGTAKDLSYPNSKGRDWNKFNVDLEEEKPEGEAALNALFKQIYGNGSDEQRKAMIKSFTESNGTVLSTNWDEVGSKKVEGQPPKGMEAKPYI